MPFDQEEFEQILKGCDKFSANGRYKDKNRIRIKALVLLMRHSGLRIGDAVLLKRERIINGSLFLHTQKTGTPVHLPLSRTYEERFTWLLRARAYQKFGYDPDGAFSQKRDEYGLEQGRACEVIQVPPRGAVAAR